ncbi:hypothetical protein SDC9_148284 [bioreactor metagenome]|uniref:N-sulphoglucosamine sulphohydrolase C-terminal domain-containing protein n=1 Tax=bioreactor metagenome TaxID=1076179 RepID=A0A645EK37_9ZZZZ
MNIENTMKERWDLKIATPEELRDTTLKDKFYEAYHRMTPEEQKHWDEAYAPRIKEFRENKLTGKELVRWKYQQYMRDYLATTLAVDDNVGRLLKYLEDIGELDNTIIVYTSDQGFFLGEHGWFDKRFMYEECQRMPLLIRYPKLIQPGSKSDALCMNVDFAPTLLDMAGVKVPGDMQGKSLLSVLKNKGEIPENWRKAVYYHYYEYPAEHSVKRHYGIRTRDYKLIHFYNDIDEWEMYDLQKDPLEMNNIYNNQLYLTKREELVQLLKQMRASYNDTTE